MICQPVDLPSAATFLSSGNKIKRLPVFFHTSHQVVCFFVREDFHVDFELSGEKTDAFGRFIVGVDDYVTEDSAAGPWWLYDSETNPDCVSASYCSGIDQAPIYDKDLFTFTFTSSFE